MRKQINNVKNFGQFLNENLLNSFKKGDKVLVNPDIIKNQMKKHEEMIKKSLGNYFKKEIHMGSENTDLYNRALSGDIATITWVEKSKNDNTMVNLIFDDGFECSVTKSSILKVNENLV